MYYESYYGVVFLDTALSHHGTKGQKWGVRRWQYQDGSLTPDGYIHYGYGRRDDGNDYKLAKGLETQRFTKERDEEVGQERKYVTYTEKDKQIYKNFYPKDLRENSARRIYEYGLEEVLLPDRVFETKLTTIKDLNVAGKNTYVNAFREIYENPDLRKKYNLVSDTTYDSIQKILGTKVADVFRGHKQGEAFERSIKRFDFALQKRGNELNDDFFERLKAKGYDAVEDQFSKRVDGTEGALIILDPEKSVRKSINKELLFDKDNNVAKAVSLKEGDKVRSNEEKSLKYKPKTLINEVHKLMDQGKDVYEAESIVGEKYDLGADAVDELLLKLTLK